MTPIAEVPTEMKYLAAGCVDGHPTRVLAILLVAFEQLSIRKASTRTGVPRSTIQDDRMRFRTACTRFEGIRLKAKMEDEQQRERIM